MADDEITTNTDHPDAFTGSASAPLGEQDEVTGLENVKSNEFDDLALEELVPLHAEVDEEIFQAQARKGVIARRIAELEAQEVADVAAGGGQVVQAAGVESSESVQGG